MPPLPFTLAKTTLLIGAVLAQAAEPRTIRAPLQPPNGRRPAPVFRLEDASGKTVRLSDYRGKVVLLNFWATECGGCRFELPWFMEVDQVYRNKGVTVLGISMDILYEDLKDSKQAWSKVNPFVQAHRMRYPILMQDEQVTKLYNIEALPATFLIDTSGRIAATYIGLINKENVEANIDTLLKER